MMFLRSYAMMDHHLLHIRPLNNVVLYGHYTAATRPSRPGSPPPSSSQAKHEESEVVVVVKGRRRRIEGPLTGILEGEGSSQMG